MVSFCSLKISLWNACTVLVFFIAGLLSVALRARRPLGAYRIPPETGLLIPSVKRDYRTVRIRAVCPQSHIPIRRAGGKAVISRLAEGAIDGATLRGVDFRVASGLLLARGQTGRTYVPDTTFQFYWS